jgi:hypothetical protein
MHDWNDFPYPDAGYDYEGDALKDCWDELHRGDREPFPAAEELQQAWRCFHRGDFQQAVEIADAFGIEGHAVANKATGIYATYLEEDQKRQIACYKSAIARAERAIEDFPEDPNSHYFHAFNLGRYSQSISIVKALKQGVGGKIHGSLSRALELQPLHAEAHTALGMYHAEIIRSRGSNTATGFISSTVKTVSTRYRSSTSKPPRQSRWTPWSGSTWNLRWPSWSNS